MLVYVGLLYQDLIRRGALTAEGKLPPVFPLLLYNGRGPWGSPLEVAELIAEVPGGLRRYQPRLSYFLLDEGRVADQDLAGQNLMAALVRLERSRGPGEVQEVLTSLLVWLDGAERAPLRRAFAAWIRAVLLPARMPQAEIPEVQDLQEVRSMLAERVVEWTEEWRREGFEEGLEQGLEKGFERSLAAARKVLVQHLERRFGPLPPGALAKLDEIDSVAALLEMSFAVPGASRLADLGLE